MSNIEISGTEQDLNYVGLSMAIAKAKVQEAFEGSMFSMNPLRKVRRAAELPKDDKRWRMLKMASCTKFDALSEEEIDNLVEVVLSYFGMEDVRRDSFEANSRVWKSLVEGKAVVRIGPANKIAAIRAWRDVFDVGIHEAKKAIQGLPTELPLEEANELGERAGFSIE